MSSLSAFVAFFTRPRSCTASSRYRRKSEGETHTLPRAAQLDAVTLPGGSRLLVILPPATIVAVANIRPTGSSAIYNSRLCKSQPAPA
jgi:hypothetical protein